jgi:hypothetical protein
VHSTYPKSVNKKLTEIIPSRVSFNSTITISNLSRSDRAARYTAQRREFLFPDWLAAAEAAWEQFLVLFPDLPRRTPIFREDMHRNFDKALSLAYSHLLRWDPFIHFFGLPGHLDAALERSTRGHKRNMVVSAR